MDKLIQNGNVAVIYSPGYGAGWSTWALNEPYREQMVFDPKLAALVIAKTTISEGFDWNPGEGEEMPEEVAKAYEAIDTYVKATYPSAYDGGVYQLRVRWIPEKTRFIIEEYDGSESITELSALQILTA